MTLELGRALKAKLVSDVPLFGPWVGIPDPTVMELMARLNFDFLLVDGEHSPITPQSLAALLPSADLYKKPVIYRPRSHNPSDMKTALDAGAAGVMIPMVETAEQAHAVVEACKYSPNGRRGIGPWRASGFYEEFDTYLRDANAATTVVVQIETARGLENVGEIAAVEGIDVLFVGPADLAASLNHQGNSQAEYLIQAFTRVADAAKANGITAAIDLVEPRSLPRMRALGFSLFTSGSDMGFVQQGGSALLAELSSTYLPR